jgi:hypothetical protein
MTQEEKQLLLKALCGYLPYGVKVNVETTDSNGNEIKDEGVLNSVFIDEYGMVYICIDGCEYELDDVKPYLRTMSSMTEDEKGQYNIIKCSICPDDADDYAGFVDWLNEHHLDYRELIPMGLALPAKEGMY